MKQSELVASVGLCVVLCVLVGIGCNAADSPPASPGGSDVGSVRVALSAPAGIAGYQIDVAPTAGGAATSRFVAASGGAADALFTLSPGDYLVTATPAQGPGMPDPSCSPASSTVTVQR